MKLRVVPAVDRDVRNAELPADPGRRKCFLSEERVDGSDSHAFNILFRRNAPPPLSGSEKRLDPAIGDLSALDAEIKALEEAAEQYRREDLRLQGRLVEASSAARAAERELKRLQEEEAALISERKTAEDALAEALVVCGFADVIAIF